MLAKNPVNNENLNVRDDYALMCNDIKVVEKGGGGGDKGVGGR